MDKELQIVIDDGSVEVPVKNTLGEQVGMFRFKPTDIDIVNRYNDIAKKFPDIVKVLTDEGDEGVEKATQMLNEAVDELFGGNAAEAFFGVMNPFSPIDGVFYCERVLEAVGNFISAQFDKEVKKIDKRVKKYTQDYQKKGGGKR